ncbi:DUF5009 domain-containing protein [Gilvimarinus sp. 1_MG-2023]|uniref:DUF5009 domain-containing protein n=1 Tax=Gilvimarinus sp. 1_MG-2023 TaxID=3062638 RepID=UPI0026E3C9BD|nr:DUF5009 domain-containing protein [Gilvimarinus sp. 1_MG-2023]MDO6747401.1 DUF5009 domain-containing protein [Gilvimarinus sp. 1_MG-2023]
MKQPDLAAKRVLAIDVFRGITILTMVFVNELAGIADIPGWMKHLAADANGMTFVDLVFPAFLFIVGMSIPFACAARLHKGDSLRQLFGHIALRSISLIIIGVFMVNTLSGYDPYTMPIAIHLWTLLMYGAVLLLWCQYPSHWPAAIPIGLRTLGAALLVTLWYLYQGKANTGMTTQWWGILGLIGWAYLMAGIVYLGALQIDKAHAQIAFLTLATLGFLGLYLLLNGTREFEGSALQLLVENNRNNTHTAIVLAGAILATLFYHNALVTHRRRYVMMLILCSGIAALAIWPVSPISKIWATPTWALFSIFFCTLIFTVTHYIVEVKKHTRWCQFFAPAAANPLLVYILPFILLAAVELAGINYRPAIFDSGPAGIFWSAFFALVIMWIAAIMSKMGVKLKL